MKFAKIFIFVLATIAVVLSRNLHKKHRKIGGKKQFMEKCTPNLVEFLTDFIDDDCADGLKCYKYENAEAKCKKIGGQDCLGDWECYDGKCSPLFGITVLKNTCDSKLYKKTGEIIHDVIYEKKKTKK